MPSPKSKAPPAPPADKIHSLSELRERLEAEAAKFDAARGGTHKFNNIRAFSDGGGANWTANFGARGTAPGFTDSVELAEMREVLKRVQAEMPKVDFNS